MHPPILFHKSPFSFLHSPLTIPPGRTGHEGVFMSSLAVLARADIAVLLAVFSLLLSLILSLATLCRRGGKR